MRKSERVRMQGRPCNQMRLRCAIQDISQQRMPQRISMDSYLMRSPRHWPRLDQSRFLIPFNDLESRLRRLPVFVTYACPMLMPHIDPQRMLGDFLIPLRYALHDGVVNLLRLPLLKLDIECAVRLCIAGEDHHAAGDLIEPVDDPYFAIFLFKDFHQVGRVLFPAIRQDREPGGFIYDQQIFIFVNNLHNCASTFCAGFNFAFFASPVCLKPVPRHISAPPKKKGLNSSAAIIRNSPQYKYNSKADTL